ncbi:Predicted signal transduction protein [Thiobacillus denitrificans ATCC 25259]|uniref:Predicted signal transduction protein n=1 Tax=Thiobacillus denitrificans (strain ATCC 25259 / T1) TaxID=292415 RepID=Q3SMJ2_THIDA|nr:HDOD domain-containing protein [Thiobacillus denitrificans]AAZ96053.1 Predicted signal transduction protein [Thiobacillus denitrificans ATCC 25259]
MPPADPHPAEETALDDPGLPFRQSALDILLRRMRSESDFPALSEAIGAINRIAASDREGVNELSNNILKDFALTNKLLRLANVAFYNQVGGGSISTISRAVVILGFDAVRSIALSLILFDNLENKAHAQQLKEEFVKLLYAGMLAREMAGKAQVADVEEAFIGAMLHKLGRMLAMFYFPAETAQIEERIAAEGLGDSRVSSEVLGVSFENLGIGIARSWGFPDQLVQSMKKLPEGKLRRSTAGADRLRALAGFSNALCEAILDTPDSERGKALAKITGRFSDVVPIGVEQLAEVMEKSMHDFAQFALAVNVNLKQSDFAQQASKWAGVRMPAASTDPSASADDRAALESTMLHEHAPILDDASAAVPESAPRSSAEIQAALSSGLQDVGNSLIDDNVSINDILRMILEAMYTGMGFDHVVLCIKDGRRNAMCGKFGFGDGVQDLIRAFDFPLTAPADVFLVALQQNADILITDIDDAKIATRIPAWYRARVAAHTFALFPIIVRGKAVGLIYADRARPGDITIPEKELSLLKSLRNQAVLAIRQSV